jgi:hypothetical protein
VVLSPYSKVGLKVGDGRMLPFCEDKGCIQGLAALLATRGLGKGGGEI